MTLDRGEMRIIVENDNLAIINTINRSWSTLLVNKDTIVEVKNNIHVLQYIKFSHCRCQENRASDILATKSNLNINSSAFNVHRELTTIICQDNLGYTIFVK